MKKILFALLLLFSAHFLTAQSGVTSYDSIISNGIYRKFSLYIPANYNANNSVPLVINLHGYTSSATQQAMYTNFMPIADTAGFILVHPEGTKANGQQFWNAGFGAPVNDVQFISNLIDSIKANYNVNLDRVYSCGMSNGGIMSYYLALNLSSRVTAIASVTGSMLNAWFPLTPNPARAFPVMEIHGTADGTVPYNGDGTFKHIDSIVKKWRQYNSCSTAPVTTSIANTNTSDNSTVTHYVYQNGTNGSSVELYKVLNGSHSWPGAPAFIPNTNQDFIASVEIWRFFRQYKTSQFLPSVNIPEIIHQNGIVLYPNPAQDRVNIRSDKNILNIKLYDVTGKMIAEQSKTCIDVNAIPAGLYTIEITTAEGKFYKKLQKEN